jgi:hypothetical protein
MAIGTVTSAELKLNNGVAMGTFVTVSTEGVAINAEIPDHNLRIHIKNLDATTTQAAVIKKGNGLQGVADLEIALAPAAEKVLVVESGRFKNVSGDNKGKVVIMDKNTANTQAIAVAATVVPF